MTGEVPGGAVIVGLVDSDIEPAVANDVPRVLKPAHVAEFGDDGHRGQPADSVDLIDQCAAARLLARDRVQLGIERHELGVERVDDLERDVELFAGGLRQPQACDPLAALE